MSVNFVVYKRLSKQKQEGNQYGFDSQAVDLNNFLKTQEDYDIIAEFGEFFSGKGDWQKRQELVKAVNLCKETGATLLVSKIDRLGRNVASVAKLLETINVKIATMPSATNMVVQILSSVAEEEARAISERVKSALSVAKTKGVKVGAAVHGNKKRTGMSYNTKSNIDSSIGETLKFMRNMGLTYAQMADKLNQEGKKTPRGNNFEGKGVYRMCQKFGVC